MAHLLTFKTQNKMKQDEKIIKATAIWIQPELRESIKRIEEVLLLTPNVPLEDFEGHKIHRTVISLLIRNKLEMCN